MGKGLQMGQGNCTMPDVCTCLCKDYYHPDKCRKYGIHCRKAWKDPLGRSLPIGYTFGGTSRLFARYESDVIVAAFDESSRTSASRRATCGSTSRSGGSAIRSSSSPSPPR